MTVSELIEELKQYDGNMKVGIEYLDDMGHDRIADIVGVVLGEDENGDTIVVL